MQAGEKKLQHFWERRLSNMGGKIIAVCGGNGSGKSTICTNLAVALSADKIVIVFGTRTDYPSIQSFFNVLIPEEKSTKKLYEDISMNISVDIKEYLIQYGRSNIFILSVPDNTKALTFADESLLPSRQQCKNIIIGLQQLCDYLIIDCDTDISNNISAWGLNYADKIIHTVKPTQQGLRFINAYQSYYNEVWRGELITVANADKNYIGIKDFEKALNNVLRFDICLPYDEQVELSENTGVPVIEDYHRVKLFGTNYKESILQLVDLVTQNISEQ